MNNLKTPIYHLRSVIKEPNHLFRHTFLSDVLHFCNQTMNFPLERSQGIYRECYYGSYLPASFHQFLKCNKHLQVFFLLSWFSFPWHFNSFFFFFSFCFIWVMLSWLKTELGFAYFYTSLVLNLVNSFY